VLKSAYGGARWSPRTTTLAEELGGIWGDWGVDSETGRLRAVLLHRPGAELDGITDFDAVQMRADVAPDLARSQHDALAEAYRSFGVEVHHVDRVRDDRPNAMFVRDLVLMTPEGAVVARPASTVRAGEERNVAEALAALGVPILLSVRGSGTFEGADVLWVDRTLAILAEGLRTNREGADQVERLLRDLGVDVVRVGLPYGAMHLDGCLALLDRDLAAIWPNRTPLKAVEALRERGFRIVAVDDEREAFEEMALNGVCLAPGHFLMPAGAPAMRRAYEEAGVRVEAVDVSELIKAGGAIHCLTGVLKREPVTA
jgi:N-dimethylarginine dimethylaminohydrolase